MKIDLKILLVILAVVLLVGFLEAEPFSSRRRISSSSSRRRSFSSGRRRTSSYSRRRRSSSSSSSSSSGSSTSTVVIIVVVIAGLALFFLVFCCIVFCRRIQSRQEFEPEIHEFENRSPIYKEQDGDAAEGEPANENNPPQSTAFDNAGVDAGPLLPYPPGISDQNPVYPQTSLPYPPQEGIYPPDEVKNTPPYPTQYTSSAYPPQGMGEEVPGVHQETWPGQAHEGSTTCAPPIQYESGHDLPPPPAYDDIEAKKKL